MLRVIRHPKNGGAIIPFHYSYQPGKDAEWAQEERNRYPSEASFNREMECDFASHSGAPAYPNFSEATHLVDETIYHPRLPLCLSMDFNVSPSASIVAQIVNGVLEVHREIFIDPGTVEMTANEFRTHYPNHLAEVWVHGDATGKARGQTAKSSYDLFRIAMVGYSAPLVWKVPEANPGVMDSVNDANLRLRDPGGVPGVRINRRCEQLIQDLKEVRLRPDGKAIEKSMKPDDPYRLRTHVSDAFRYLISWHWPVRRVAQGLEKPKPRPKMVFDQSKLLGGLR